MASTTDDKGFDSVEVRHRSIEEVGNQPSGGEGRSRLEKRKRSGSSNEDVGHDTRPRKSSSNALSTAFAKGGEMR